MRLLGGFLAALLVAGCAGSGTHHTMNNIFTPNAEVLKDKYDGATIVQQEPVNAGAGVGEPWHVLGFDWSTKTPQTVFVTAGIVGTTRIGGLAFNADGTKIENIKLASENTDFERSQHGPSTSYRRFSMSLQDFLLVARAKDVKMRLSTGNTYSVSSFGPANPNAIVNSKFKGFTDKVLQIGGSI